MQFRLLTAIVVFIGSYLPLSVILLAQNIDLQILHRPLCWPSEQTICIIPLKNPVLALTILSVCAMCFVFTLAILTIVRPKHEIVLVEAKYVPTDLMNYTLPYVVSFMSVDYQDMAKCLGLLIFLAWMFWITYKSGQIALNPLLIVFGWRLYELKYRFVSDGQDHIARALSKGVVDAGETHRQANISEILMIKPGSPRDRV